MNKNMLIKILQDHTNDILDVLPDLGIFRNSLAEKQTIRLMLEKRINKINEVTYDERI